MQCSKGDYHAIGAKSGAKGSGGAKSAAFCINQRMKSALQSLAQKQKKRPERPLFPIAF
jgi:hypothetical protein